MEYLKVGTIVKPRGLIGEMRIYSTSDFRELRFKKGNKLFLYNPITEERQQVTVKKHIIDGAFDIVTFNEITTIEQVEDLRGFEVQVIKDKKIISDDAYFHDELLACDVYANGVLVGRVSAIEEYAAYRTLRVKRDGGKDILIPFVAVFINNVDISARRIEINPIEGLL